MPGEARPAAAFEKLDVGVRPSLDNWLLLLRLRLCLRPLRWLRRRRLRRLRPTLLSSVGLWWALRWLQWFWRWLRDRWPALLRVGLRRLGVLLRGWRLPVIARSGGVLGRTTSQPIQARLRTATVRARQLCRLT